VLPLALWGGADEPKTEEEAEVKAEDEEEEDDDDEEEEEEEDDDDDDKAEGWGGPILFLPSACSRANFAVAI